MKRNRKLMLGLLSTWAASAGVAFADGTWRASSGGDGGETGAVWVSSSDAPIPAVWIGVRLAPVPEALAAHIGENGLMIVNIAKGGPADLAGVQRYDVLRSINGKAVPDMDSLGATLTEIGAGGTATVKIIRGGKEETIRISPAARPSDTLEFKFDEPQDDGGSADVRYFGHSLKRDATGNWVFEPLGRLGSLPQDIRDRLGDIGSQKWQSWMNTWKDSQAEPFRMRIQVDPADPDGNMFFFPDGGDADEKFEMSIKTFRDGAALSIQREQDGRIRVLRETTGGNKTEVEYESVDQLKQQDNEAYEAYRRYSGYRARPMITVPPELKDLDVLQRDFQERIQKLLEDARAQMDEARKNTTDAPRRMRSFRKDASSGSTGGISVSRAIEISEDGSIRVAIVENGQTRTYRFQNREQFEREEPELFKEFELSVPDAPATPDVP